jgi:FAD synthase
VGALGQERGFDVAVVPPFELDGRPVRSSDIRAAIAAGELAAAEASLGRPYAVVGEATEIGLSRVAVRFAMPVAMPPAGERDVTLEFPDGTSSGAAYAIVGSGGDLTVAGVRFTGPARIVFDRS